MAVLNNTILSLINILLYEIANNLISILLNNNILIFMIKYRGAGAPTSKYIIIQKALHFRRLFVKIDRMLAIIMLLLERNRVSIPELAQVCGVTTRTVQRDLEAINRAGVPVVSFPGVGGGVGIAENYKLEKRLFSAADVTTLLMGLGSVRSAFTGDEVVEVLAKIKGMLPADQRAALELKAGQITIDTTPWLGGRALSDLIALLQAALDNRCLVRFDYNDRLRQKSERTVEPYRLILKGHHWYFEGFCLTRHDFRIFRLSRMAETVMLDERYQPREFMPHQVIEPVFADKDVVAATLRVRGDALERLVDLCGPECVRPESGENWIATVPMLDNVFGYQFLLGFGPECECLAPEGLRRNFVRYIEQIASLYQGPITGRPVFR